MLHNTDFSSAYDSIRESFNSSNGSVIIAEKKQKHTMKIRFS
jgi:hypothetical protein